MRFVGLRILVKALAGTCLQIITLSAIAATVQGNPENYVRLLRHRKRTPTTVLTAVS